MKSKSQLKEELISRRQLMKYMLGGMAGSLLLPSLIPSALAQTLTSKRKIVFVYAEQGATARFTDMRPAWFTTGGSDYHFQRFDSANNNNPDNSSWSFNFNDSRLQQTDMSEVLAPLYAHRNTLTVLEGLSLASTSLDTDGDAHAQNHLACMSGVPSIPGSLFNSFCSRGSAPSMDQRINDFLKLSDPNHNSLNYRMNNNNLVHEFLYYNANRSGVGPDDIQRLPTEVNPRAAFDSVFAPRTNTGSADQAKIFQLLNGNYTTLANRLSAVDKSRIDTHRALLSDLSNTMNNVVSCGNLAAPASNSASTQAEIFEAFARMIASGFSCGLSRVASLGITNLSPSVYGLPGVTVDEIHGQYEHGSHPNNFYNYQRDNDSRLPAFLVQERAMVTRNVWQLTQLKKLADIFAATPDPSGNGSLLDTTLIVYINEQSHGDHGGSHWPVTLLGGFDGAITPGRYIKYAENIPSPNILSSLKYMGPSNTQLFISILQAFGMNIDALGVAYQDGFPSYSSGDRVPNAMKMGGPLNRFKI